MTGGHVEVSMKKVSVLFGISVVGVVFCFIMTIVTSVQDQRRKSEATPIAVPTPAMPSSGS